VTLYVVITKDRQGDRHRWEIRQRLGHTDPIATSRHAARIPSDVRNECKKLFGIAPSDWKTGADLGVQDYVVCAAVLEVTTGTW
jgi:hypothetical protein